MIFANPPIIILALSAIFHHLHAAPPHPTSPPPPTTANLHNLSLHHLSSGYLQPLQSDLTLLKISHSTIGNVDRDAFDHLHHLNLLEISDSRIAAEIHPDTFSRLPGLEMLVLTNLALPSVHLNLTNVQQLILSRNDIRAFHGHSVVANNLNYLDLSDNGLTTLQGSFANLTKLSLVDVSKNNISDVGHVFEKNLNLLRILASENKITSTSGLTLPWLKNLDLFSNRISALESDSFPEMAALEELVLAFNDIGHVGDAFRDLIELRFLNLAWNRIEQLQPHLFRNNLYLTQLSLQGNKLKAIDKFQTVHHHLTHLDLSHNHLALVNPHFFASTPALQVLDLSFNRLHTLQQSLAPLPRLQRLDLAYNQLTLTPQDLSHNANLLRLNLSSNALQGGVAHFAQNRLLKELDLSGNAIVDFCDADVALKNLARLNLRGNRIRRLQCLRDWKALCEVDVNRNPLVCGEELDGVMVSLATRGRMPYRTAGNVEADGVDDECESLPLNRSLAMWNAIRLEVCPEGGDLKVESERESQEDSSDEDSQESRVAEALSEGENGGQSRGKQFLVVPIGWIGRDEMSKANPLEGAQSERKSWEKIEENAELLKDLEEEEEEEEEESGRRSRFSWYTIALILIGLSLTLTCFNLVVFLYIRMKVWKRADSTSPQRYTFLRNEVYKNTTEPTKVLPSNEGEFYLPNHTQNKILSYGKISHLLLHLGLNTKPSKDTESAKNVLISPKGSSDTLNC